MEPELTNGSKFVRFEVITALSLKIVVLWNIKFQFVLHWRLITSPLPSPAGNVM
jgi:hypothetical protein